MKFFLLRQDDRVINFASLPVQVDRKKVFLGKKPLYFDYKVPKPQEYIHFLPFIERPVFMVLEKAKKIFDTYQSQIEYRDFGLGNLKIQSLKVYYFMRPPEIECLSSKTEFHKNGDVKKIVLDLNKVGYNKVFRIQEIRENYLVASLEVVETLLYKRVKYYVHQRVLRSLV